MILPQQMTQKVLAEQWKQGVQIMYRNQTKEVRIGDVVIGGDHPIVIQSMTNTRTEDVEATVEQILRLVTDEGDFVIDPFAGSGTTVVAAKMLKRKYLGIDILPGAVELTEHRLESLIKTESVLLKKGKKAYQNLSDFQMDILKHFQAVPVQRNSGID